MGGRHVWKLCVGVIVAFSALPVTPAMAEERPLLVTYGEIAPAQEGDNDHAQVIYLSVPAGAKGPLYLRLFDPETADSFDLVFGRPNTITTFSLFGGSGAYAAASAAPRAITPQEGSAGTWIAERSFENDTASDGRWQTFVAVDPAQGDLVGNRRIFRLVVLGGRGDDGNVYDVFLSTREDSNLQPEGLQIFSFSPTVRIPDPETLIELRLSVPPDTDSLIVGNFDGALGNFFFGTEFVGERLAVSGQDSWRTKQIRLLEEQRGARAAITLAGGLEIPNDVTLYVTTADGTLLPIALPPRAFALNARPVAVAVAGDADSCTAASFDASRSSDADGEELGYLWHLGDGESAAGATVEHDYGRDGRFTARLVVTDTSGLLGHGATASVEVLVKEPPVPHTEVQAIVAPGEDVTFDGSGSTAGEWSVVRQAWSFPDGKRRTGATTTYRFPKPGDYVVLHEVRDDSGHRCNTAAEEVALRVNAAPVAEAGEDQRVSVGQAVSFDGRASLDSDGHITAFRWDFGDGATAEGATVQHAYATPGTYMVTLEVADDAEVGNSTTVDQLTVIVNDPPVAAAGPDASAAIDEPVTFDGSTSEDPDGEILSYRWDFGDGTGAEGAIVEHAYAEPDLYRVRLTVGDDSTTDTAETSDELLIRINAPPVADAGKDQLVTSSLVAFDGTASSDPDDRVIQYDWDFGDGSTGSGPRPTHVYEEPGTYEVQLVVTDDSGTIRNTASASLRVVVNAIPIADAGPDLVGAPGEPVVFEGSRSLDPDGEVVEYYWDFRDGTTASGEVVTHAFDKPGIYRVRLRVRDDTGHAEAIDYADTRVFINSPPVANGGPDVLAAPGDAVRLTAAGSFDRDGEIASYRWDVSDGSEPVMDAELIRTFAQPGIYSAQLTVSDDSGAVNSTAKAEVRVAVNHSPVADAGPDLESSDLFVTFDGSRSLDADGDDLTYRWDFGDGESALGVKVRHLYAAGGNYPVVLEVDDGTGLRNAASRDALAVTINQPPIAVAGDSKRVCTGDILLFDGTASTDPEGGVLRYRWDFGDGSRADIVNPTKTYRESGVYPVTLMVRDDSGLENDASSDRIFVRVDQGPLAVAGEDIRACANTPIDFDGSQSFDIDGAVNGFTWDFGDGTSGAGERTTHIYHHPGEYRVLLAIQGEQVGQCDTTSIDEMLVHIDQGPVAIIDAPESAPMLDSVVFDGSASHSDTSNIVEWLWDFGDGQQGSGPRVAHSYASPGLYRVTLTLQSDSDSPSCQSVFTQEVITINATPIAVAGSDRTIAVGETAIFDAAGSSDPDGGLLTYHWDFGDGETAAGVEARHRYAAPGRYRVTLTVRDDSDLPNAAAGEELFVIVNAPPEPVIGGPEIACVGDEIVWSAEESRDPDGAIQSYAWLFGDGSGAEGATVRHRYARAGEYRVALTADDGSGLANGLQQTRMRLAVEELPTADAGPNQLVCPSEVVSFGGRPRSEQGNESLRYLWDLGDGSTLEGPQVEHAFAQPGTYQVRLTVSDEDGARCAANDSTTVVVNASPVAVLLAPESAWSGGANDAVLLDASQSHDPDGEALTYAWKLGDGTTLSGELVRHAFTGSGEIPLELLVADQTGLDCGQASAVTRVFVQPRNE